MTPERRRDFEHQWPDIQSGLKGLLARKKVPFTEHDDLIQETALRLYGMWGRVDPGRSPWPLAVTIALNLVRDGARRRPIREVAAADVPDVPDAHEVERAGLARVELGRVRDALHELSPAYRSALLVEVGDAAACAGAGAASQKMTRVRARRKLAQLVEKVSALLPVRLFRFSRWQWSNEAGQWVIGAREGVLASIPCIACLAVGVTTVVATNVVAPGAAAQALTRHGSAPAVSAPQSHFQKAPRLLRTELRKGADSSERVAIRRRPAATHGKPAAQGGTQAASSAPPSTTLPTPPEVPSGDEGLPVDPTNPSGNGDGGGGNVVGRVKATVDEVTKKLQDLPGL